MEDLARAFACRCWTILTLLEILFRTAPLGLFLRRCVSPSPRAGCKFTSLSGYAEEIAEDGIDDSTGLEISATKSDAYKNLPTAAPKESRQSERVEGKL